MVFTPNRASSEDGSRERESARGGGFQIEERRMLGFHWASAQEITIYGAGCFVMEHDDGSVWILAPLAKIAPRRSYEAEDVPNTRTRT